MNLGAIAHGCIAIAKTIRTLNLSPAERDAINRVCPVECLVLTEVTTAISTGLSEFREWMGARGSKYSIFAVESPVEQVAETLSHLFRVETWMQHVSTGTLAELQGVPIVQFKNSPWAVVYWNLKRSINLKRDCRQISQKIAGKVIQLWEADESGWIEWMVWQNNDDRERAERMYHNDSVYFESFLRKRLNFKGLEPTALREQLLTSVNDLLTEQGVYIPSLDLNLVDANIERVDVLVVPAQPLGMWDFQTEVHEGHPEYAIFAVKAPIEQVSEAVATYVKAKERRQNVREETPDLRLFQGAEDPERLFDRTKTAQELSDRRMTVFQGDRQCCFAFLIANVEIGICSDESLYNVQSAKD